MRPTILALLPDDPASALRCLEGLADQPALPEHDVVLVDAEAPGLAGLLARLEGDVDIVRVPAGSTRAAAVRAGLARAPGDVVVVLDGTAAPAPGWLAPLCAALDEPGVAAATAGPGHPAAAPALAARRADLAEIPDVPDELTLAALTADLAARGAVRPVPACLVRAAEDVPRARGELGREIEVSVVIPTLDAAADRVRACVRAVQSATDAAHEIILIDNGSPPQGFTAPVNAGLRAARGRYMVVLNDDVEVLPGWWPPLRDALDAGASVAFPRTVDGFDRDDFNAWCFAISTATVERHGVAPGEFLDPELVVWFQDTDLLTRLRAAGERPVRIASSTVRHGVSLTVSSEDPALKAWIHEQVVRDRAVFDRKHPDVELARISTRA